MTKSRFLEDLRKALNDQKKEEVEKTVSYYSEMIDDRIDSGMTEEEAVSKMGSIDEIVNEAKDEVIEEKEPSKKVNPWVIALVLIGLPLWLPILGSIFSVALSIYISIIAIIIVLWACNFAFLISSIGTFVLSILNVTNGFSCVLFYLGVAFMSCGIALILYKPILSLTKIIIEYTKTAVKYVFNKCKALWNFIKNKVPKIFKEEK